MRRHTVALTVGFVDDSAEFVERESWDSIQDVVMNPAATVGINLDPIGAMGKLFAHRFARTLNAVHCLDSNWDRDIPGIGRLQWVRASYVHGATDHLHARSPDQVAVNGIAHVDIGVARAFGFEIADGGKTPIQGCMRGGRRLNRAIGHRLLEQLRIVLAGLAVTLKKNVRVRLHHAGQARQVWEIDHLCACRRRELAHLLDPVALDGDDHIRLELVGLGVEQRPAADVNRPCRWRRHELYRTRSVGGIFGNVLSERKSR